MATEQAPGAVSEQGQQPTGEAEVTRSDSITRNTVFGLATQITTAAFTAGLTLFLVRALGPDDYGVFALAVGIATLLVLVCDFGITGAAARYIAELRHEPSEVAGMALEAGLMRVAVTLPVVLALWLLAEPIANAFDNPDLTWPLRLMGLVVIGQGMFLYARGVFNAVGRVSYTWQVTLLESIVEFIATILLVVAAATATAATLGRGIGYMVGALIGSVLVFRLLGRESISARTRGHARTVTGYAGALFIVTLAFTLFEQIGTLMVGAIEGTDAVGIFEAPTRLTVFLSYGGQALALGVAPRLARGREGPNTAAFLTSMRYLTIFQAALVAPLLAWSTPIVNLTLGSGYEESASVLRALTPFVFLSGIGTFVTLVVNYIGEAKRRVPLSVATAVLVAVLNLILIPAMGVVGAAVSMDVAFAVYTVGHIWLVKRAVGVPYWPIVSTFIRCLIPAGVATLGLAAFGTDTLTPFDWVAGTIVGSVLFVGGLFLMREFTMDEVHGLRNAVRSRLDSARS